MILMISKYNYIELCLLAIGLLWIIKGIVWPIIYILLFSLGYTIFHAIAIPDWKKLDLKHYFKIIPYLLWRWPIESLQYLDSLDSMSIKGWNWTPLFKYYKE